MLNVRIAVALLALLSGAAACSSGGSGRTAFGPDDSVTLTVRNQVGEPVMLRYAYQGANAAALGQVEASGEARYTFRFLRGFDLRITGDFVERRSGSSNPIMDLRPGDALELTINQRKELVLSRAGGS